jgi:predicted negative regulator of RcsB-dependent stress response
VDRLTRKELKTDKFAIEVQHGVEYVSEHRKQMVRWGIVAAVVAVAVVAWIIYSNYEHGVREQKLGEALRIQNAQIGPTSANQWVLTYPTDEARRQALNAALTELATKYGGSEEGTVAQYLLGTSAADKGNLPEAERRLKEAIDGKGPYTSMATLALARVEAGEGRISDAENLLRGLIQKPTVFVSKEQATIVLAQILGPSRPAEARKLLEPLRTARASISRIAITEIDSLPRK